MKFVITTLFSVMLSFCAHAEMSLENCVSAHQQCASNCLTQEKGQAACITKCAASEAQCAGGIGLEKTVPFIRDTARELENLFNDLLGDFFPEMIEKRRSIIKPEQGIES